VINAKCSKEGTTIHLLSEEELEELSCGVLRPVQIARQYLKIFSQCSTISAQIMPHLGYFPEARDLRARQHQARVARGGLAAPSSWYFGSIESVCAQNLQNSDANQKTAFVNHHARAC
jgi:hypothetical protein